MHRAQAAEPLLKEVSDADWPYHRPKHQLTEHELCLTYTQLRFLDWLTGERPVEQSQNDFERELGLSSGTLSKWKKLPTFRVAWRERIESTFAAPETLQDMLGALLEVVKRGKNDSDKIRAAEAYWKIVDRMTPKGVDPFEVDRAPEEMTDEELEAAIAAELEG